MSRRTSSKIDWGQIAQAAAGALVGLFGVKTLSNFIAPKLPADFQKYVPAALGVGVAMGAPMLPMDQRTIKLGIAAGGGLAVIGAVASAAGMNNPVQAWTGLDFQMAGPMEREISINSTEELRALTNQIERMNRAGTMQGPYDLSLSHKAGPYGAYRNG